MKFRTIVRYGVIGVSIVLGASCLNVTAQEVSRDAIYSRFEEYYSDTSPEKIREVLDAFAQHLKANRSLRALLISYGGKQSCRNEALLRARLATRYLSKKHGIPSSRSTVLNGGYREDWVVELWVGSSGATAPSPTRTINKKQVTISGKCKFTPLATELGQSSIPSDSEDKTICVLGNVIKPSLLRFRSGITVTQVIKQAGGIPPE